MARAVPTDVVQAIVEDNRRAAAMPPAEPNEAKDEGSEGVPSIRAATQDSLPPIPAGFVRPLTGEALERWLAENETPNVAFEYDPFAAWRLR